MLFNCLINSLTNPVPVPVTVSIIINMTINSSTSEEKVNVSVNLQIESVQKRDGRIEPFSPEKIAQSIERALAATGIKDILRTTKIAGYVVTRLNERFKGEIVPTTSDVRDVVQLTFIDQNLAHAGKRYLSYRLDGKTSAVREPIYGYGISVDRYFTRSGVHPYDEIKWEYRDARITNEKGEVIFEQKDVEVPSFWSQTATNIAVQKYFAGEQGSPTRESSARELIGRVAHTISDWGRFGGYFASPESAEIFEMELTSILINQRAAFNSPVWFNVGLSDRRQQCSACFIQSVQDDMHSILTLAMNEGMLFKYGSGTGSNISSLRSSKEHLGNSINKSSGPVSFMKAFDAIAGVVKSGGKTRRAAKMVILNVEHPDILDFVRCKAKEEKKAWALMDAGYDGSMNGEAYFSIFYQNANNSVRVSDEFMQAVVEDKDWWTRYVKTGEKCEKVSAREMMREISEAAWQCGDPGMQYDTTINRWHTGKNTGRINASNPCVTGDTLVSTARGYRRIIDLVGKTVDIVNGKGEISRATRVWKTGYKPVYELNTKSGYTLKLTGDHRVLTQNRGDVAASELKQGDLLMIQNTGFGNDHLDVFLAEAIGLAIGDGCISVNQARKQEMFAITAGRNEQGILESINDGLNTFKQFNASDDRSRRWNGLITTGTGFRINSSARSIVEPAKKYAVLDQGSQAKQFTDSVFNLDKESQCALLRGLFTADGTVAHYGDKSQYISLDSTSETLLKQAQLLLLGFGIKAKLYKNRRTKDQTMSMLPDGRGGRREYPVLQMHSLRISRNSRKRFANQIGFVLGSEKNIALAKLNESVTTYADRTTDEFESFTYIGEEDVYDLTEPVTNHFVANGLVVHNCSEYMYLDDTACNLASLNLMKFRTESGEFDTESFKRASEIMITAMEIVVGFSSYPTPAIEQNSFDHRSLGLGYANLGALLMARGLPYDSDEGRNFAGAITSLMSGAAYSQSSRIAEHLGPFRAFAENRAPMLEVMNMHRDATYQIDPMGVPEDLVSAARASWDEAVLRGEKFGFRNSQISVLAPTGTISFLMDCDTTGVEPDIALVKYKWLVGGGMLKLVNNTVPEALARLGYAGNQIDDILAYINDKDTIEGAPHVKDEHLAVFDCAFKPQNGTRTIQCMAHLRMMSAVQPFISGAISKTVNMSQDSTPEDIANVYIEGWRLGLKAIAIYRDGSKRQQPLTTSLEKDQKKKAAVAAPTVSEFQPRRRRLPDERRALTHKFSVGGHEGYITVGLYDDGQAGEIFITMAKEGSVISGLMDSFATAISISLQYGVPLRTLVNKFVHTRFEPSGFTGHPSIKIAKSVVDYIFRWMALKFLPAEDQIAIGLNAVSEEDHGLKIEPVMTVTPQSSLFDAKLESSSVLAQNRSALAGLTQTFNNTADAPVCDTCGAIMVRNAACYKCLNCGGTSGCS